VRTQVANLSTRSVRYLDSGSGRPLIWLHAFPLSADQWLPQLHRVPPGWRFVAPDLRGFRGTGPAFADAGLDGIGIDDYAADVVELMSHLDIAQAVIGGLSMGGYVAFAMCRRAPERVGGLVLANTRAAADSSDGRAARDRMLDLTAREGAGGVADAMLPKLLGASTIADQPDLAETVGAMIRTNAPEAIEAAIRAMKHRPDSTPLLGSLRCPTIIIAGEEDALISPAEAEAMHRAVAGSRLVTLPAVGHVSNLENAVAFNAALADTLESVS
jgi:pimeloyl-ACP methyl ester carboxylesterase